MPLNENELRAIHAQACAAVLKSDRALSPVDEAFWPRYIQAILEARRALATPFCYAYLYPAPGGPVWRTDTGGREINGSRAIDHRALFEDPPIGPDVTPAVRDVLAERVRHASQEGFTPVHDDQHDDGSLVMAATCYAQWHLWEMAETVDTLVPINWPWDIKWWKPTTPRRNLVKAASLLLAEIERMDRDPGDESGHHHTRGGDL